jgi:hypothetical protein
MRQMSSQDIAYEHRTHVLGRIWNITALVLFLLYPVVCGLIFRTSVSWPAFITGFIATAVIFYPVTFIEFFTFVPMLGSAGSYLAFVTGNLTNLKIPCALNAMDKAGVSAASEEGELISTIAIATSSIVTTVIVAAGVLLMAVSGFGDLLASETLAPAFNNIMPALFGALGVVFIAKDWKTAVAPAVISLLFFIFGGAIAATVGSLFVTVSVVVAIVVARILYKRGAYGQTDKIA